MDMGDLQHYLNLSGPSKIDRVICFGIRVCILLHIYTYMHTHCPGYRLVVKWHVPCATLQKNELALSLKTWIGKEIAMGLAYLATVPIVHRYIKCMSL